MSSRESLRRQAENLPVVVISMSAVSLWLLREGVEGYPRDLSTLPILLDPLYYVGSVLVHAEPSQYLTSVAFFLPAGIVLTYLTHNRNVLAVVAVAHLPCAFLAESLGGTTVGLSAAAYGLLAATLVHAVWSSTRDRSGAYRVSATVAVYLFAVLVLVTATGGAVVAQFAPVVGFVLGGGFEAGRVIYVFGHSKPDESDVPDDVYFKAPRFRTRWENMASDEREAEELNERYSRGKASPDDTRSGSGGRSRTD